jgi:putative addiction module CopG family antidote
MWGILRPWFSSSSINPPANQAKSIPTAHSAHSGFLAIVPELRCNWIFGEKPAAMPTRNVNLTDELDRFVARKVKTGRYENASEVVRAELRTLEREEQQYAAKLARLTIGDWRRRRERYSRGRCICPRSEESQTSRVIPLAVATFRFSRQAEADDLGIAEYVLKEGLLADRPTPLTKKRVVPLSVLMLVGRVIVTPHNSYEK